MKAFGMPPHLQVYIADNLTFASFFNSHQVELLSLISTNKATFFHQSHQRPKLSLEGFLNHQRTQTLFLEIKGHAFL